jgi:FkbM family methyltransferase
MLKSRLGSLYQKMRGRLGPPEAGVVPKRDIEQFLPVGPVIVEAGAHIGVDTREMAKRWRKATIHAFEPVPDVFDRLTEMTKDLPNVKRYRVALGEKADVMEMYVSGGGDWADASSSLLPPKAHLTEHPHIRFDSVIRVPTMTLDAWAQENGVPAVDFLWLDMQGYELKMLKSAPHTLKTVKVIYTEVCLKELYAGCPLYPEFRTWLEENGFHVKREELAWHDAGNVLFVRQE